MNIFKELRHLIIKAAAELLPDEAQILQAVNVEIPKDLAHGDAATNVALLLAKPLRQKPLDIAMHIAAKLAKYQHIDECVVAAPGFINIHFTEAYLQQVINAILQVGCAYGDTDIGQEKLVNVEFVSANPTGPMHVGHSRSALYGDVLCRLLQKCNYQVVREYYVNDAGSQIDVLVNSLFIRYQQLHGMEAEIPEGGYPGEYVIAAAQRLQELYRDTLLNIAEEERAALLKEFAVGYMLDLIKRDLASLGVHHDIFISEKMDIHNSNMVAQTLELLQNKGLLYRGILEPPKGKMPDDWEPREQTLFKATAFGDDVDRPLQKSDGSYTYFAADIAYHFHKLKRGFGDMVLLLGADHSGYVKRMQAVVAALSDNQAHIDIKINQLVNLLKDGQPFKMSKRLGNFITVQDLLGEISKDVLRFIMLGRKNDTVLDIDINKAQEQSKDNPYFYVQYAHARVQSLLRNALEQGITYEKAKPELLCTKEDLGLIKKIAQYPKVIESAGLAHEPHRITYYLNELANEFHSFWARGMENEGLRWILPQQPELTAARLALAQAVGITIASGLDVLGIKAAERM